MTQHTQGEWSYVAHNVGAPGAYKPVDLLRPGKPRVRIDERGDVADARLMAAAPLMLDALRDALNVMTLQRDVIEHGRFMSAWQHPISVVEHAIAAATGTPT